LLAFAGAVRSSSFLLLLPIRERSEQVGQGEYVAASSIRKRPKKWRFYGKRWGTRFVEEHREISAVDSLLRSSQRWPRSSGRSISPVNLLSFLSAENPLPPPPLSLSLSLLAPAAGSLWLHSCSRNSFCLRVPEDRAGLPDR